MHWQNVWIKAPMLLYVVRRAVVCGVARGVMEKHHLGNVGTTETLQ